MSWETVAKIILKPLPLRFALTVLVAAAMAVLGAWLLAPDVRGMLVGPQSAVPLLIAWLVASFAAASVLVTILVQVGSSIAGRRARRSETKNILEAAAVQRQRAERQRESDRTRLRALVRDYPAAHQAVLERLHAAGGRGVALRTSRVSDEGQITSVLLEAGFIALAGRVDGGSALYVLTDIAKPAVDEHFHQLRIEEEVRRRRIAEESVAGATDDARFIMRLFGQSAPERADDPEHPWIEHREYATIAPLVAAGMLVRGPASPVRDAGGKSVPCERIALTTLGTEMLTLHVLGSPPQRTSITLRLDQIASSMAPPKTRSIADGVPYPEQTASSPRRDRAS